MGVIKTLFSQDLYSILHYVLDHPTGQRDHHPHEKDHPAVRKCCSVRYSLVTLSSISLCLFVGLLGFATQLVVMMIMLGEVFALE